MQPGPNYVYKCPECGNYLANCSLLSGNTFNSILYSDGKRISPMLPDYPNLTKCNKCNAIFWLSKLQEVGTYEWDDFNNLKWKDADYAQFLNIEDLFRAIDAGIAVNQEEELIIRRQIWWTYNDRIRNGSNIFEDDKDELLWKENVEKLLKLLDKSDINHRIMIAEINRNSGNFENCIKIIQSIEIEELAGIKEIFLKECERKNKWVIELI